MKLFQLVVFFGVACTGIYYEWTPNGYVLGLLSIGAAFFSTLLLSWALDTSRVLLLKQRHHNRLTRRR